MCSRAKKELGLLTHRVRNRTGRVVKRFVPGALRASLLFVHRIDEVMLDRK